MSEDKATLSTGSPPKYDPERVECQENDNQSCYNDSGDQADPRFSCSRDLTLVDGQIIAVRDPDDAIGYLVEPLDNQEEEEGEEADHEEFDVNGNSHQGMTPQEDASIEMQGGVELHSGGDPEMKTCLSKDVSKKQDLVFLNVDSESLNLEGVATKQTHAEVPYLVNRCDGIDIPCDNLNASPLSSEPFCDDNYIRSEMSKSTHLGDTKSPTIEIGNTNTKHLYSSLKGNSCSQYKGTMKGEENHRAKILVTGHVSYGGNEASFAGDDKETFANVTNGDTQRETFSMDNSSAETRNEDDNIGEKHPIENDGLQSTCSEVSSVAVESSYDAKGEERAQCMPANDELTSEPESCEVRPPTASLIQMFNIGTSESLCVPLSRTKGRLSSTIKRLQDQLRREVEEVRANEDCNSSVRVQQLQQQLRRASREAPQSHTSRAQSRSKSRSRSLRRSSIRSHTPGRNERPYRQWQGVGKCVGGDTRFIIYNKHHSSRKSSQRKSGSNTSTDDSSSSVTDDSKMRNLPKAENDRPQSPAADALHHDESMQSLNAEQKNKLLVDEKSSVAIRTEDQQSDSNKQTLKDGDPMCLVSDLNDHSVSTLDQPVSVLSGDKQTLMDGDPMRLVSDLNEHIVYTLDQPGSVLSGDEHQSEEGSDKSIKDKDHLSNKETKKSASPQSISQFDQDVEFINVKITSLAESMAHCGSPLPEQSGLSLPCPEEKGPTKWQGARPKIPTPNTSAPFVCTKPKTSKTSRTRGCRTYNPFFEDEPDDWVLHPGNLEKLLEPFSGRPPAVQAMPARRRDSSPGVGARENQPASPSSEAAVPFPFFEPVGNLGTPRFHRENAFIKIPGQSVGKYRDPHKHLTLSPTGLTLPEKTRSMGLHDAQLCACAASDKTSSCCSTMMLGPSTSAGHVVFTGSHCAALVKKSQTLSSRHSHYDVKAAPTVYAGLEVDGRSSLASFRRKLKISGQPKHILVQAVKDHQAVLPGELSFKKGQLIKLKRPSNDQALVREDCPLSYGYYRVGRFRKKKHGLFPSSCVVPVSHGECLKGQQCQLSRSAGAVLLDDEQVKIESV